MVSKLTKFFVLTAAAAALAGCSTSKHEPMPLVKITQAISADTVWSKSLSSADGFLVPAVYDDVVFAAGGKTLSRMNARSGEVEWSVSFDSPITAGVGSDGYVTAVGLEDGTLQVVDAEGKVSWSKKLTTDLASPPVVAQGLVIVRTLDTRVSAFEASSGDEEWIYQKNQPALTVRLPTGMLAHDTVLFVGQPNGHVVILDIPTGKAVFEFSIAQSKGITEVERLVDVVGYPAFSQDLVCAAAYQGAVTCIDSQNGQTRWSQPLDAVAGPAIDEDTVYGVAVNGEVKAFYRESGEERWTNKEMLYRGLSAPVVVPGAVAVGDAEGYVHLLSPRTGEEIGRLRLSGPVVTAAQPFSSGAIFQTSKGDVAYIATR